MDQKTYFEKIYKQILKRTEEDRKVNNYQIKISPEFSSKTKEIIFKDNK